MLGPSLTVAHLSIASLCAALMIGLGFLARPGRATVLWSTMFVLSVVAAYGSLAAADDRTSILSLVSLGALLPAQLLVWSGLRAARGARATYAWLAPIAAVGGTAVMLIGSGSSDFSVIGSTVIFVCTLFSLLVLVELYRRPERGRGVAAPLVFASAAWPLLGITGFAASILNITSSYELLTQTVSIATLVYLVCALVTLLFLSRIQGTSHTRRESFGARAQDRLRRAEAAGERTWVLLDIRLDDAEDLTAAAGEAGFTEIAARYHAAITAALPAEADIGVISGERALVLISRPSTVVRASIRTLMDDLAAVARDSPVAVQLSASVGSSDVATRGYDFTALTDAAGAAALKAITEGGGRWERDEATAATSARTDA